MSGIPIFFSGYLILIVLLCATGCTSPLVADNVTVNLSQKVVEPISTTTITPWQPVITPAQTSCPSYERKEYRVIQGQPFTYQGAVPDNSGHSVDVIKDSELVPSFLPSSVPVDPSNMFSFTINGNDTQQDWEDYTSTLSSGMISSPYDHICLRYSTGTDCFDLLIVQDKKNLTALQKNTWIHIDPIPDQIIFRNEQQTYNGSFFINGTTNLPPGKKIDLSLESTCGLPCPKMATPHFGCCGNNYDITTNVLEGSCGFNTWSFFVNTSPETIAIRSVNGDFGDNNGFLVFVTRQDRIPADNGWDMAHFFVRVE